MTTLFRSVAAIALGTLSLIHSAVSQDGSAVDKAWADALREKLTTTLVAATNTPLEIISIRKTPFEGLVEVELNTGETLFSDLTGDYLVTGDLFRVDTSAGLVNLTAEARQAKVAGWIAAVPEDQMIIFRPEQVKGIITVFTDVDCTYCRKLHGEIDAILAQGIEVRYMAYPRGGEASTAYPKMISVWCSDDRKKSLTQAKHGQNIPARECQNHVLEHYNLGNKIGITGTPSIVLKDGTVIPGYLDSQQLAAAVFGQ